MSRRRGSVVSASSEQGVELSVRVRGKKLRLWLRDTAGAEGTLLVAVDRGTARFGDHLRQLAARMQARNWNLCSVDLLTLEERRNPLVRFDIPLLAERLAAALHLARSRSALPRPLVMAASGNAVAAGLWLHTEEGCIDALVSVGGRPHLAEPRLGEVRCPTLLLVSERDARLLHLNRMAERRLGARCTLTPMPESSSSPERNPYVVGADIWLERMAPSVSTPPPPVHNWRQSLLTSRLLKTLTGALVAVLGK